MAHKTDHPMVGKEYQYHTAHHPPAYQGDVGTVVSVDESAGAALWFVNEGRCVGAALYVGLSSLRPVCRRGV